MDRYLYADTHEATILDKVFVAIQQKKLKRTPKNYKTWGLTLFPKGFKRIFDTFNSSNSLAGSFSYVALAKCATIQSTLNEVIRILT